MEKNNLKPCVEQESMMTFKKLRKAEQWLSHRYGAGIADEEDEQALNLFSDLLAAELKRQMVRDVQEAIDTLQVIRPSEKEIKSGEYPDVAEAIDLAIEALKAYRPVRENRTTEPCEWCEGNTGVRPKAKFCPFCGRKL